MKRLLVLLALASISVAAPALAAPPPRAAETPAARDSRIAAEANAWLTEVASWSGGMESRVKANTDSLEGLIDGVKKAS